MVFNEETFAAFCRNLQEKVQLHPVKQGYSGRVELAEALHEQDIAIPHAVGEMCTHAVRFCRRRHYDDLLKVAGWAYVAYALHRGGDKEILHGQAEKYNPVAMEELKEEVRRMKGEPESNRESYTRPAVQGTEGSEGGPQLQGDSWARRQGIP